MVLHDNAEHEKTKCDFQLVTTERAELDTSLNHVLS